MSSDLFKLGALLTLFTLVLAACAQATPEPTEAPPAPEPTAVTEEDMEEGEPEMMMGDVTLTLGFTSSLPGRLNASSTRQNNGLSL